MAILPNHASLSRRRRKPECQIPFRLSSCSTFSNHSRTLILMSKNAAFTQTRAASETIELISMADVVPAFTTLYGSIDVLKHRRSKLIRKKGDCGIPIDALNTVH
jgi:hypothetical protein